MRIALNRARMAGRRGRLEAASLPRVAARAAEAKAAAAAADGATEAGLEAREERERLLAAVRELPDEAQAVVTLRYLEGLSAPAIAEALGVRPEAVRMRLSRALRTLRERLVRRDDG